MKTFEYADHEVGRKEIAISVASMMIGVGILTLPRSLALATESSDGWISILLAGGLTLAAAWLMSRLARRFHKKTFFEYTSMIVSKPAAYALTLLQCAYFLMFSAYETRAIAGISKFYLFERTPVEAISLSFLLIVIYAVSGSRAGIIRLNVLFLPIVLFIAVVMLSFSIGLFQFDHLQPHFISSGKQIMSGTKSVIFSLLGFELILFYASLMNRPKDVTKAVLTGISIPLVLYMMIYLFAIGIFSRIGTLNIMYPAIEIAKEIIIPGEFFERFESIFFVIWIMTIFNTTCMALDIAVLCLTSMFSKTGKRTWIMILSPVVYLACMFPKDEVEFYSFGTLISLTGVAAAGIMPGLLLFIAKIRGVKDHEQNN